MAYCSQASQCLLTGLWCFVYNFQTLLTGLLAIAVAIRAGIPVWRQLKDSNLQTRISHRETLANLLRDALRRYAKVDSTISRLLGRANQLTSDPAGETTEIETNDAFELETQLRGVLDWYLVVLANTEHADIEKCKTALKSALDALVETLTEAHWADHADQHDEDHDIPDNRWAEIVAGCAKAKVDAALRVSEARRAYKNLETEQGRWVQSLRLQIARLDLAIASPEG